MTFTRQRFAARKDASKYGKRHKPGVMNQTEAAYAEILQARKAAGEILEWMFESHTLKLADDTRYTPDFKINHVDGSIEFVDAEGGGPIDPKSLVKIKCAAEKFWEFTFVIAKKKPLKQGGGWDVTTY